MDSPRCFAHRTCTVRADPHLVQLLLARFEAWRAPLATSPIPPRPSSCSTPLDTSCLSLWAPGQFLLPDANVSSTCSFHSPLGRSGSRGMTTSSTDSLRLSRALPSEFSRLLRSERLCTSSNALCSVLGRFVASSSPSDASDAPIKSLVRSLRSVYLHFCPPRGRSLEAR